MVSQHTLTFCYTALRSHAVLDLVWLYVRREFEDEAGGVVVYVAACEVDRNHGLGVSDVGQVAELYLREVARDEAVARRRNEPGLDELTVFGARRDVAEVRVLVVDAAGLGACRAHLAVDAPMPRGVREFAERTARRTRVEASEARESSPCNSLLRF